eukprot:scaffold40890_cov62-Attheya_sp.AAC.8
MGLMGWNLRSTPASASKCGLPPQKKEVEERLIGLPRRGWKLCNTLSEADVRWTHSTLSEGDERLTGSLMEITGTLMTSDAEMSKADAKLIRLPPIGRGEFKMVASD